MCLFSVFVLLVMIIIQFSFRKWLQTDRRSEPRRGERVPYVVVNGSPGLPLIRLVRSPAEYLADTGLKINAQYYISKVLIPPLNRCLLLIGVDVIDWYAQLPRAVTALPTVSMASRLIMGRKKGGRSVAVGSAVVATKKSTISQYFATNSCAADCGTQTRMGVCDECCKQPCRTATVLSVKMANLDRKLACVQKLCQSCCGRSTECRCCSLDCPVFYVLNECERAHEQNKYFRELLAEHF